MSADSLGWQQGAAATSLGPAAWAAHPARRAAGGQRDSTWPDQDDKYSNKISKSKTNRTSTSMPNPYSNPRADKEI
jgi:hypothetical protein